jgi:hypothetical protein
MTTEVSLRHKDVSLLEVLDRVLDKGVIVAGDLTISVADVDLIYLGLRVLLCSVETMNNMRRPVIDDDATIRDAIAYIDGNVLEGNVLGGAYRDEVR